MNIGEQAFQLVQIYSQFGCHRTGSIGGRRTSEWLAFELANLGAEISIQPFDYFRFDCDLIVRSGGNPVSAMPLYYTFTGQRVITNPATGSIDAHDDEEDIFAEVKHLVALAKADRCDGLVLATQCPTGTLCAVNSEYGNQLEFPVILVGQRDMEQIQSHGVCINYSAAIHNDQATNLTASFQGPESAGTMLITTPVSGWFQCAGERGCGIAVAIHLAKQLSQYVSVNLIITDGHELGFIGGFDAAKKYTANADWVLHLGSCIATHSSEITCKSSASTEAIKAMERSLEPLGIGPVIPTYATEHDNWLGESRCWAAKSFPILSFAGINTHFHTPDDIPEVATTPALLAEAIDAIFRAIIIWIKQ